MTGELKTFKHAILLSNRNSRRIFEAKDLHGRICREGSRILVEPRMSIHIRMT